MAEPLGLRRGIWIGLLGFIATAAALRAEPTVGQDPARKLVIGSKNFAESRLLAEMLKILVEDRSDFEVEHRANLGGTLVCMEALRAGAIDVYPEYTGTGWTVILEEKRRASDPMRTYFEVAKAYRERWDIEWLSPFGLDNTYVLAISEAKAASLGITTISDLVAHGPSLTAGFSIEFMERPDGWPGLREFYSLQLGSARGLEHGLAYEALAAGEVDLVDAYATDGKLLRYPLRRLKDDRGFFPPYQAAPIVRGAVLRDHPELRSMLDGLAYRIDDASMTKLNHAVEVEQRGFREVAMGFLRDEGLTRNTAVEAPAQKRTGFWRFFLDRWRVTLQLVLEHIWLTAIAVALAALVALPLGIWIQGRPMAARISLAIAGVIQTIPSLALLALAIAVPGLGLSTRSAIAALFLYSLLPILRNTHAGLGAVDAELVDAAKAIGLTKGQVLRQIKLPMAMSTILAGLRTATVISFGVVSVAASLGAGGLGQPIVTGLYLNYPDLVLSGALPAGFLALAMDFVLGRLERRLVPRGLRA